MSNNNFGFAFPVFDQKGEYLPGGAGLTKLEYTTIELAKGMLASKGDYVHAMNAIIVDAHDMAKQLLQKCNL